jgi:uncharacterized membrane protein
MPFTTLAGHPLHPQLVGLPIGMIPFGCAMDALYVLTGRASYAYAGHYALTGSCLCGMAAGATGAVDYLSIPADSQSKKTANLHGLLNLSLMGVLGVNWLLRKGKSPPSGKLPFLLSLVGAAGMVVSQWYGGKLVYQLGMRVEPLMEGEQPTEWKLPQDEQIRNKLEQAEQNYAPAGGPEV